MANDWDLILVLLIRKVYNDPSKTGLVSKIFTHGLKYAILEQYRNMLIF